MYIPAASKNLEEASTPLIRLGIQGEPGTGKTWSALTFPNPVVLDFDNKLQAHHGKKITVIPFHDSMFVASLVAIYKMRIQNSAWPPNTRDVFKKWLREEGPKFEPEQTLILDSWTMMQDHFDIMTDLDPPYDKSGQLDTWGWWRLKLKYAKEILSLTKSFRCHFVCNFHENWPSDENGRPIGKTKPLMAGQMKDMLQGHFSDWYRMRTIGVHENGDSKKPLISTNYLWQVRSDNYCECTCSKPDLKPDDYLVKADYEEWFGKK